MGTYVATHVYKVAGIERAFDAGMKSIEHGHLADEPTIAMLAERDVWLSTQPFAEHDHIVSNPENAEKNRGPLLARPEIRLWRHFAAG